MGGFDKLPGTDVRVVLNVVPELKELLVKGDYIVMGASVCGEHEVGVILIASRATLEERGEDGVALAKCFADSAHDVIHETFLGKRDDIRRVRTKPVKHND